MEAMFWASLIFLAYVFIGYPVMLPAVRLVWRKKVHKRYITPSVTIVVAVRNEKDRIERRLQNLFEVDYPKEKLQLIVSLDGPSDGTEAVVQRHQGIEMVHSRWHRGKAAAINAAMERASGEIVVFADARQTFSAQTVRELVANFSDFRVGAATGELVLVDDGEAEATRPLGLYWRYEKRIRALESDLHSVVGVTGAVYAIRRELFQPLSEDALLDDVIIPMRIVLAGKRVVFDSAAKAFDQVACCPAAEYKRKVRTLAGNYQLMAKMPELLRPFHNPIFWQFLSHKVARLMAPFGMAAMFASNALLVDRPFYAWLFAAQSLWYACALIGYFEMSRAAGEPVFAVDERRKAA